ncbi:MAG: hypothetical protein WC539_03940 [Nitrospirota bacterium]
MQILPFSFAAPGMELAREIKNPERPDGPPMCGKGVVLTEALISRLKQKNIQAITVKGRPVKIEGEKTLEEMLALLDRRFRRVKGDSRMDMLKDLYRKRFTRFMGE